MFDRFTYKQKNYGLLVLFILLVIVCYKRTLSVTFYLHREIDTQELRKQDAKHADTDFETLQIQLLQLNKNIGKSDLEPDKVQQKILRTITQFSIEHQVMLDQLEQTHELETVDFNIYSNVVAVKGSFNGILELVYYIENEFEYARIVNVGVYKEENKLTRQTELYGKLLFQHYRQKK